MLKNDLAGENECCGLSLKLLFYFLLSITEEKQTRANQTLQGLEYYVWTNFFPKISEFHSLYVGICLSNNLFKTK